MNGKKLEHYVPKVYYNQLHNYGLFHIVINCLSRLGDTTVTHIGSAWRRWNRQESKMQKVS